MLQNQDDDRWYAWYMDYVWAFVAVAFPYVVVFIFGLLLVMGEQISLDFFNDVALVTAKYALSAAGIGGSLWALYDYLNTDYQPARRSRVPVSLGGCS